MVSAAPRVAVGWAAVVVGVVVVGVVVIGDVAVTGQAIVTGDPVFAGQAVEITFCLRLLLTKGTPSPTVRPGSTARVERLHYSLCHGRERVHGREALRQTASD